MFEADTWAEPRAGGFGAFTRFPRTPVCERPDRSGGLPLADCTPVPGQEFADALVWVAGDAVDDVGQPGFGVEAVEAGGGDQGVEHGGALAAGVGAGEEVVLAAEGEGPDGAFGGVVGHFQTPVGGEAGQGVPAGGGVADGAGQGALAADLGQGP